MILASNSVKAFRVSVAPSEFISNVAEFGSPMFRLESLNPKEEEGEKLPEGYTRVGWIAGIGDAIIIMDYCPNHDSEILIDRSGLMDYAFGSFGCGSVQVSSSLGLMGYAVTGQVDSDYADVACLFGSLSSPEQGESVMFPIPHEDVGWELSGDNPFEGYAAEIAETRYSIYMSKDELRVGTDSRPNPLTPASIDPWDLPFTLFGSVMSGSGAGEQPMPDMIFSFKVSENGVPVVNMLPCIEDSTGQPGFYDTVRDIFITGEGTFFTGDISEPEPLPADLYTFDTCTHYSQVGEIYPDYIKRIRDWNYYLNNLQIGGDENGSMFVKTDGSANTTLRSFSVDLPALTNGRYMFRDCTRLTSFTGDMSTLADGTDMFSGCKGLTSFTGDLPALTNGRYMFRGCYGLTSFTGDMPALTDGRYMFSGYKGLTSFAGNLPALTNGNGMFYNCTGLTSFTGNLTALTNGWSMFDNCTGLTSWDIELPNLTDGRHMFRNTGLTSWDIELPNLTNGNGMFYNCIGLTSFTGNLPNLTSGNSMFYNCIGLTSWDIELPNLTNGGSMFGGTGLTSFAGNLPALTYGESMFYKTGLTSWDIELPNLTNGDGMFAGCKGLTSWDIELPKLTVGEGMFNGTGLTSWDIELPNLTNGTWMFYNTGLTSWDIELPNMTDGSYMFGNTGLTSFKGNLPNLTDGSSMFGSSNSNCTKLDLASVQHIANTINNLSSAGTTGSLYLGMDASLRDTEDLETALAAIRAKGWTVTEMYRS